MSHLPVIKITCGPVMSTASVPSRLASHWKRVREDFQKPVMAYSRRWRRFIKTGTHDLINRDGTMRTGLLWNFMEAWFWGKGPGSPIQVLVTTRRGIVRVGTVREGKDSTSLLSQAMRLLASPKLAVANSMRLLRNTDYRPYLLEALDAFEACPRGIWHVATNGGKTRMAAALCERLPQARVLLVAPRINSSLAIQGHEVFHDVGLRDTNLIKGSALELARRTWASGPTIDSRFERDPNKTMAWLNSYDLIIKDECHDHASKELAWWDACQIGARLGMSGTPFDGQDGIKTGQTVGVFGPVLHHTSNTYLIQNGYSSEPWIYQIRIKHPGDVPDADYPSYMEYMDDLPWRRRIVGWVAEELHSRGYRVVVACEKREAQAIPLAQALSPYGRTEVYTGTLSTEERRGVLERFSLGQTRFLVATRIFDVGLSCDAISAIILAGTSKKPTVQLQRIGRGLRRDDGRNRLVLVDLQDHTKFGLNQARVRRGVWESEEGFNVFECKSLEDFQRTLAIHEGAS